MFIAHQHYSSVFLDTPTKFHLHKSFYVETLTKIVNEGTLYSDRSKLSVAFYLRARSIRGRSVFEEIRYVLFAKVAC